MMEKAYRCEECGAFLDPEEQFCGECGKEIRRMATGPGDQPWATLKVIQGPEMGQAFSLGKAQLTLGRGQDVDLFLEDAGASREHARIECKNEAVHLTDLGSSNGTYLNGSRIIGTEALLPGDLVTIGDTVMEFQIVAEGASKAKATRAVSGGEGVLEGASQAKAGSSKMLLVGGAGLALVVCLFSMVLISALVILPILKPDTPPVTNPGNPPPSGEGLVLPPSGEDPISPPSGGGQDFPPSPEDPDIPPGIAALDIVNNGSELICFINISPSKDDEWGGNWLEEGEILRPGSTKTFYIEAGFLYDWLVQDCDENILVEEYEIRVEDGLNILLIEP